MRSRRALIVGLVVLVATSGLAAGAIRPVPGTPDPRQMVLSAADVAGKVTHQGYYKDKDFPSTISYARELENGRFQGTLLLYLDSEAEIGTSAETTLQYLLTLRRALGTKQGRALIVRSFEASFPKGSLVSNVRAGPPRALGVGPGGFDLLITVRILGLRTEVHITAFAVERVLGSLVTVGAPGGRIQLARVIALAKLVAARMTGQLAPVNTVAPAVTGTAEVGQTLTASAGTWAGATPTFAYQWQRCDQAGASCADIPAATAPDYVLTSGDVGSRIRVVVAARNAVGSATAASSPTQVVLPPPAPGAPKPIVRPSILGVAQVGQTLTVATGTWSGNPTSFSFQWVHCPANLVGCGETIEGATQGTYVVATGDVGSRLWVDVTAANEFGRTRTSSAPTAAVVP